MEKTIQNWFESSDYDFKTAQAMYKSARFVYVIFMCHLAVEKSLKAIVSNTTKTMPPKTHDLQYLLKLGGITVPPKHQTIITHLNEASVPTRYPQDIALLIKAYNKRVSLKYLTQTRELLKWLKRQIR